MMNEDDSRKIQGFIDHLFGIQTIKSEPVLVGENLILNFIAQNQNQLKLTFKAEAYFPNREWGDVLAAIVSMLYVRVSDAILPHFLKTIESADFEGLNKINDGSGFPSSFYKEKLTAFLNVIFKNKEARLAYNSVYSIFIHGIIEKYCAEIWKRREVMYNELVRVQKTNLECEDYIVFLKTLLIIKNAAYLKVPFAGNSNGLNLFEAIKVPGKLQKYLVESSRHFRQSMPALSERSIQLALKANLKCSDIENDDASSKFLYILCSRFNNYRHLAKVDRGAESPDKSWFSIARKNADALGCDKRMLDALYRLAGDNNW